VEAGGGSDLGRDAAGGGEEIVPVEPACADGPRAQAVARGRGPPERACDCPEGRELAGVDSDEAGVDAVELRVREEVRLRDAVGRAWTRLAGRQMQGDARATRRDSPRTWIRRMRTFNGPPASSATRAVG
jgi:hypothetical protein